MADINVGKLAQLSRIAVSDKELKELEQEIPAILSFVEQIAEAGGEIEKETGAHYNVFRTDENPHETGEYSEELQREMPSTQDGFLKVRKIISQD